MVSDWLRRTPKQLQLKNLRLSLDQAIRLRLTPINEIILMTPTRCKPIFIVANSWICLLMLLTLKANGQNDAKLKQDSNSRHQLYQLTFTTEAYQAEVLRLLLAEANYIAKDLNLEESVPITKTNLVEVYIPPPRIARGMKVIGNVTTPNYMY